MHLKRLATFAVHALLALAVLELCARLDDRLRENAPVLGRHSIDTLFGFNEHGRYGIPGARFGKWALNSLGYRGNDPVAGRESIVVFGASESFGLYESPGKEYPAQLQGELDKRFPGRFAVLNAAMPGVRVGNQEALKRALTSTEARYVILYPSPAHYIGVEKAFCDRVTKFSMPKPSFVDAFRLPSKLQTLLKAHAPEAAMLMIRRALIAAAMRGEEELARVPDATIAAFARDVGCAIDLIEATGAKPVLMTHATLFGSDLDPAERAMMTAWRQVYPILAETGFLDLEKRANVAAARVAEARGALVLDLAGIVPEGRAHFADYVHFTDRGAEIVARTLAEKIERAVIDQR